MDVLLVAPPHTSLKGMSIDRGCNVGLTSLAAYIRNEGIETAVLMGDLLMDTLSTRSANPVASIVPGWLRVNVKDLAVGQQKYETVVNDRNHAIWKKLTDVIGQTNPMAVGI